jgi:hypothetical protein
MVPDEKRVTVPPAVKVKVKSLREMSIATVLISQDPDDEPGDMHCDFRCQVPTRCPPQGVKVGHEPIVMPPSALGLATSMVACEASGVIALPESL